MNTKYHLSFVRKHDIFTREKITVAMTTRQLRFSQVRYFMAVYVINRSWYELVHDMVVW